MSLSIHRTNIQGGHTMATLTEINTIREELEEAMWNRDRIDVELTLKGEVIDRDLYSLLIEEDLAEELVKQLEIELLSAYASNSTIH